MLSFQVGFGVICELPRQLLGGAGQPLAGSIADGVGHDEKSSSVGTWISGLERWDGPARGCASRRGDEVARKRREVTRRARCTQETLEVRKCTWVGNVGFQSRWVGIGGSIIFHAPLAGLGHKTLRKMTGPGGAFQCWFSTPQLCTWYILFQFCRISNNIRYGV